ncbi:MAG: hypothetical protein NXI04_20955 [Planctomycetaceae bacterium]|nr:hypothetical protein [Planctomycetaceae bacterium]
MRLPITVLSLLFPLLFAGCGDAVQVTVSTNPSFQDAWLAADPAGDERVSSYAPLDTVYVKADLVGAAAGTEVVARLIAVSVDHPDVPANTEVGSFAQKFDGELNRLNFDFSNDGPMPAGSYQVALDIAGSPAASLPFQIAAAVE